MNSVEVTDDGYITLFDDFDDCVRVDTLRKELIVNYRARNKNKVDVYRLGDIHWLGWKKINGNEFFDPPVFEIVTRDPLTHEIRDIKQYEDFVFNPEILSNSIMLSIVQDYR